MAKAAILDRGRESFLRAFFLLTGKTYSFHQNLLVAKVGGKSG